MSRHMGVNVSGETSSKAFIDSSHSRCTQPPLVHLTQQPAMCRLSTTDWAPLRGEKGWTRPWLTLKLREVFFEACVHPSGMTHVGTQEKHPGVYLASTACNAPSKWKAPCHRKAPQSRGFSTFWVSDACSCSNSCHAVAS